jgi:diguanylate cyclase (GGDEF)-like protein
LIVCDIDYFERINDTYGHAVGDKVIEGLAEEMKGLVAGRGSAARYGGEEFVAFLPNASLQNAAPRVKFLRMAFSWRRLPAPVWPDARCRLLQQSDAGAPSA